MKGIDNGELFDWNVRKSLGKTNVNKDIARSIQDTLEHKYFLLYHNGLTVLCGSVEATDEKITISNYTVVNGCQSLTSLYDNRDRVSRELRVLTRLIELPPQSELAEKITHHSNNQNGIKARDLQSNNPIQGRLQTEFERLYPDSVFYRVKRGEHAQAPGEIDNELAARILLAFDLKEPWTCHQTYKLFDELHARIFGRPEVTADRIVALHDIYQAVLSRLGRVENQLLARYTLTKFLLIYLVREALETDPTGKQFCQDPAAFIRQTDGRKRIVHCVSGILDDLVTDLNAEVKLREQTGDPFDYKRELKSRNAVLTLSRELIPQYEKLVNRGRAPSFEEEWESSAEL
jgi:hypothetical protein